MSSAFADPLPPRRARRGARAPRRRRRGRRLMRASSSARFSRAPSAQWAGTVAVRERLRRSPTTAPMPSCCVADFAAPAGMAALRRIRSERARGAPRRRRARRQQRDRGPPGAERRRRGLRAGGRGRAGARARARRGHGGARLRSARRAAPGRQADVLPSREGGPRAAGGGPDEPADRGPAVPRREHRQDAISRRRSRSSACGRARMPSRCCSTRPRGWRRPRPRHNSVAAERTDAARRPRGRARKASKRSLATSVG